MNNTDKDDALTLGILQAIEKKENVTQRYLAHDLGIALGLANSYLKRCVRKGLVKIHQAPANRYLYYLTPNGFAEKSRLTAEYLSSSFDFYRKASKSFFSFYTTCNEHEWHRLVLCGLTELTEIAIIKAQEFDIEFVGIWEPTARINEQLGLPVICSLDDLPQYDACILTSLKNPDELYSKLLIVNNRERIFIPEILGI